MNAPISQRNIQNLCFVLLVLVFIFGCICRSDRNPESPARENPTSKKEQTVSPKDAKSDTEHQDEGDFIVEHRKVDDPRYEKIDAQVRNAKLLENAAEQLNSNLKLPTDIYLRAKDCGEPNAFFAPDDNSITVCYELMELYYKAFKSIGDSDQKAYDSMLDAVRFAFLHELGHALIALYKLPITGNEEDAADRASAYICLEEIDDGVKSVLAAADVFQIMAKNKNPSGRDYADEHLLNEQRSYNSLCMIYGSNEQKWSDIVTKGYLPKERAARCPVEYEKTMLSWKGLLKPWRKN